MKNLKYYLFYHNIYDRYRQLKKKQNKRDYNYKKAMREVDKLSHIPLVFEANEICDILEIPISSKNYNLICDMRDISYEHIIKKIPLP